MPLPTPVRILVAAIGVLVVAGLLAGCVQQSGRSHSSPERSTISPFNTDADALAAAEAAYAAYLAMSDLIASEGGANPERIAPFVTEEWLKRELDSLAAFATTGQRQVGSTTLVRIAMQWRDSAEIAIYACIDLSSIGYIDASNQDVTSTDRPSHLTVLATYSFDGPALRLSRNSPWSGPSIC